MLFYKILVKGLRCNKREIEVNRVKLIQTLVTNKEKHIAEYQEAIKGYKEAAKTQLDLEIEKAKKKLENNYNQVIQKIEKFDPNDEDNTDYIQLVPNITIELPIPRLYSEEYDMAIEMAQWEVNDTMKLTYAEFNCFVRDNWDWRSDFVKISNAYISSEKKLTF